MELSSPRFKATAVTLGFSVWFFILSSAFGLFSIEALLIFITIAFAITQLFAVKLSGVLDIFAIFNTKFFLGALYVLVISAYGILFRILKIDLLRISNTKKKSYWLEIEQLKDSRIYKQY